MTVKPSLADVASMTRRAVEADAAAKKPTAESLLDSISDQMDACQQGDEFVSAKKPDFNFSAAFCGVPETASESAPPTSKLSERASDLIAALRASRLEP